MIRFAALLLAGLLAAAAPARAAFPLVNENGVPSVAPVLKQVVPGVVNIAVRGTVRIRNPMMADPFFRQFFQFPPGGVYEQHTQASGSGVIVDAEKGYVLTNNHVVQNADVIDVTLSDKRKLRATLIGRDPATDIAVLQIPAKNLVAVPFADSDKTEVGDFVLAIGNPFGLGQTVTSGIVSAVGRSGLGIEQDEDFIQTDAAINPGNSGGALVNLEGKLVGINTAIVAPAGGNVGVGFAIPSNMVKSVMEQLIHYGHIDRGWIGVGGQDLTPELMQGLQTHHETGAVITGIRPNSPGDRGGLRPGDIVLAVDGTPVHGFQQFISRIGLEPVGKSVVLTVERQGHEFEVTVKIGVKPQPGTGATEND